MKGSGLIPCCGDSQILISFIPPAGCIYLPIPLKLSCGAAWDERVRGAPGTRVHPRISHLRLQARLREQVRICLSFRIHQSCISAFTGRRRSPFPSLLPWLNPSHLFDDSKNTAYTQWKFGVSMKSECSNRSMEIMVKCLLTWEGAQRGFVSAAVIISVKVFIFMHLGFF